VGGAVHPPPYPIMSQQQNSYNVPVAAAPYVGHGLMHGHADALAEAAEVYVPPIAAATVVHTEISSLSTNSNSSSGSGSNSTTNRSVIM